MRQPLSFLFAATLVFIVLDVANGQNKKKDDGGVQPDGLKNLQHPDPNVRYRAATVLAEQGPRAKFAIEALREALNDTDPLVRVKVAEAIWQVERPSPGAVLPTLQRALKDKNANVRAAACGVIGLMTGKGKAAIPALVITLKDQDLSVVIAAIGALGDIGPPAADAAQPLLQLAGFADFVILEPLVGAALGSMGEPVVPRLTAALKEPSLERRRVAAYALGSIGPEARSATAALEKLLRDKESALRFLAARALGSIGKDAQRALPRLNEATADKDAQVRIRAALAVWQISGATDHVTLLAKSLRDESLATREAACQALGTIGPDAKSAGGALTIALKDPEPAVKHAAILALANIGPDARAAASALRLLLKNTDKAIRMHAAAALWRVTGETKESLPVLRAALADEPNVRMLAVEKLGMMGSASREALPELVVLYREEDNPTLRRGIGATIKKVDTTLAAKLGIR